MEHESDSVQYRVVVYWRWDKGVKSVDCFWCVEWPTMSNEEMDQNVAAMTATHILMHGNHPTRPYDEGDVLIQEGYLDAAVMLRQIPHVDLRATFNQMEREVYMTTFPVTAEEAEKYLNS